MRSFHFVFHSSRPNWLKIKHRNVSISWLRMLIFMSRLINIRNLNKWSREMFDLAPAASCSWECGRSDDFSLQKSATESSQKSIRIVKSEYAERVEISFEKEITDSNGFSYNVNKVLGREKSGVGAYWSDAAASHTTFPIIFPVVHQYNFSGAGKMLQLL